jgi:hypothetical protein
MEADVNMEAGVPDFPLIFSNLVDPGEDQCFLAKLVSKNLLQAEESGWGAQ